MKVKFIGESALDLTKGEIYLVLCEADFNSVIVEDDAKEMHWLSSDEFEVYEV